MFNGFDSIRVLTYSASAQTIVRMLNEYSFERFECVFGYEGVLRDLKRILAFQKVVVGDTRAAIMGLKDERHIRILEKIHSGQARFRVLRKHIAHAKLYLLSNEDGRTRVIVGSANLSERAFSGKQPETLVMFDNDESAWDHYTQMYDSIRDLASDEVEMPEDKITKAQIDVSETPSMNNEVGTLIIEPPATEEIEISAPIQVERIEKVAAKLGPALSSVLPNVRNGVQRITPQVKREISRVRLVKSAEDVDTPDFHVDRSNRVATLSGENFSLDWNNESALADAKLISDYFDNFVAFEGNVDRLKRDYFMLMAWLYFSPFMCDMRSLALVQDSDVIRFPLFGIVYGKSNCGKTSLVDTLMTSMFGYANTVDKRSFTKSRLHGLQESRKRFPVVFDDIGRRAFNQYGKDMIKEELQPPVSEYPCFVLSMNAEPQSFPDEVVKRSMMIHTTTALPSYNEYRRQQLDAEVKRIRSGLTGHFYKRYLAYVMDRLEDDRLPEDWLAVSAEALNAIMVEVSDQPIPEWRLNVTWLSYAEHRYDRIKSALANLLRPASYVKKEGASPKGWTIDGGKVIVWEPQDAFGRRSFSWEDVPSTLIDEDASSGGNVVLYKSSLEGFLDHSIDHPSNLNKVLGVLARR